MTSQEDVPIGSHQELFLDDRYFISVVGYPYRLEFKVVATTIVSRNKDTNEVISVAFHDGRNRTTNIEEADHIVQGHIKWDGCCNMEWQKAMHICGPEEIQDLVKVFHRLYELAKEHIPHASWLKEKGW
jgi:hypothetical protein